MTKFGFREFIKRTLLATDRGVLNHWFRHKRMRNKSSLYKWLKGNYERDST